MKKILVLCMVVALAFGATGATCLQQVATQACNPPPAVIAVVQAAAPLVAIAITTFIPGSAQYVNAVAVQGVVTAILGGACVSLTQLNNLIAWLQSDDAKVIQVKAMVKAGPMKAQAINIQPLVDWAGTFK
jgi:hypothetical protein